MEFGPVWELKFPGSIPAHESSAVLGSFMCSNLDMLPERLRTHYVQLLGEMDVKCIFEI